MSNERPEARDWSDPLLRAIVATASLLTAATTIPFLLYGAGPVYGETAGYVPVMHGFAGLAAFIVAFLAFGRYQVLRDPASYWIGLSLATFGILSIFFILAWPGFGPGGEGIIARLPNTSGWIAVLELTTLSLLLLTATLVSQPRKATVAGRHWLWSVAAWLVLITLVAGLSVVFEQYLPAVIETEGGLSALLLTLDWLFLLLFAIGALLSTRRYVLTGDSLQGYIALTQVALVFVVLTALIGQRRYDLWYYVSRIYLVGGFLAMMFGLLSEYVDLYKREREARAEADARTGQIRSIIASMADAVYVTDDQGRVTLTNDAGESLLGLRNLMGLDLLARTLPGPMQMRRLDGTPIARLDMPLARALAGETVETEDILFHNSQTGGDVYIRVSAAPIEWDGRIVGVVLVAKDITELVEVDRMKDEFIKVAAHELKTPVAIMKGYAQAMERLEKATPEQRRNMVGAIDRGADRITRIVEDLLDISQLQLGGLEMRKERVILPELVHAVVDRMALLAPKHHLRVTRAEPVVLTGDRERLEQVVVHMVENAIKYSPKGGDIDVAVDVRDHEAVVSVTDRGVGIPRDRQARIFQRFYRAHTGTPYDYGGMGVGLYISKEIIARHGGRMWFESVEGKGSIFYFSLPIGDGHARR
ncbi:MAG: PAS domain-containing protein [Chloroflexi bacterium]|nr:PAS domain-containing protein [Chloroflexota bacterium]